MKQIFVNLPVKNINASEAFYSKIGFSKKNLFSDSSQRCMVWSKHIYIMLIEKEKFQLYSKRKISEALNTKQTYFTLPVENLKKVNEIVTNAIQTGGKEVAPMIDEGFMQIRKIQDLDGHLWDIIFLDIEKFKIKSSIK